MRRSKTISLAEAMKDYIREMKLEDKLREVELINAWEETVGRAIASRTTRVYIKEGTLYVHLKSSVVRNELIMVRETLKKRLNEKAGAEVVRDIILK
jgi:predicted nucleic acid-binding Zn ribbon protein